MAAGFPQSKSFKSILNGGCSVFYHLAYISTIFYCFHRSALPTVRGDSTGGGDHQNHPGGRYHPYESLINGYLALFKNQ